MHTTLNLLKIGPSAKILSLKNPNKKFSHSVDRLYSVGFCPGREITILNKKDKLYIARVENDNPFCFREELAQIIEVDANNAHVNKPEQKTVKTIFYSLINYLLKNRN